jgi:hypothetical protein
MSLEWARARALQEEMRLRRLLRPADGAAWTEVPVTARCSTTLWLQPAAVRVAIECDGCVTESATSV